MHRLPVLIFSGIAGILLLGLSPLAVAEEVAPAEREVINRIVAVVDQGVITLVELKRRAEPFQKRLEGLPPEQRAAAEAQLHKDLLQEAINDRLVAREARSLRVSIGSDEVDRALDLLAQSKKVSREKLLEMVAEQGFKEEQYREQLVRQLLVGKLMRMKMREQLKNLDKDPEKSSKQIEKIEKAYLQGLRANVFIEVRL